MGKKKSEATGFPLDKNDPLADCHRLLNDYAAAACKVSGSPDPSWCFEPSDSEFGATILDADPQLKTQYLLATVTQLLWSIGYAATDETGIEKETCGAITFESVTPKGVAAANRNEKRILSLLLLARPLLKRKLPYREVHVCALLDLATIAIRKDQVWQIRLAPIVGITERFVKAKGLSDHVGKRAAAMVEAIQSPRESEALGTYVVPEYAEMRKLRRRLEQMSVDTSISLIEPGEAWSDRALSDLGSLSSTQRQHWTALLTHAVTATQSKPTKKFLTKAAELLDSIGRDDFHQLLASWVPLIDRPRTATLPYQHQAWLADPNLLILPSHADLWRGLAWCCSGYNDQGIIDLLGNLADVSFKRLRHHGARIPKVGNACVHVLGQLASPHSVAHLERLKSKLKKPSVRKQIDSAIKSAAEHNGINTTDLAETSNPDYGLQDGRLQLPLGDVTAELIVSGPTSTDLRFIKRGGKVQKTVPAAVKTHFPSEIRALRKTAKDVQSLLRVQRDRFERTYLESRQWPLAEWTSRFAEHPVLGVIAKSLIWELTQGKESASALWRDGVMAGVDRKPLKWVDEQSTVALWHPQNVDRDLVRSWRDRLDELQISQPFKQAHREVYVLTAAERRTRTYSNRMANHILRQHQFRALMEQRGWKSSMLGDWDGGGQMPTLRIPSHDLLAEFWVDYASRATSEAGVALYLGTDQIRFYKTGGRHPIPLTDVPPLVFSEVMRDVDLFVGVASVGNDAQWRDAPGVAEHRQWTDYWEQFSFGELDTAAATRKEVIQRLVPRLKIASRCRIEDRFLIVQGDVRTYKIHLGSGNILMEPNDEYLCIVADQAKRKSDVFLPFEGDQTLAVILSKAILLAGDANIKDETILSQIH